MKSESVDAEILNYYRKSTSRIIEEEGEWRPRYLESLEEVLAPGSTLLDLGCGFGRDVAQLRESGIAARGVDPSPDQIRLGRQYYGLSEETLWTDALPTVYSVDSSYQALLCALVLQHLSDEQLPGALDRMVELLSVGGHLLLTFPLSTPADADEIRYILRKPDSYLALLTERGLAPVESYRLLPTEDSNAQEEDVLLLRR